MPEAMVRSFLHGGMGHYKRMSRSHLNTLAMSAKSEETCGKNCPGLLFIARYCGGE